MYIIDRLKSILQAEVQDETASLKSFQYNDKPTANIVLDRGMKSPTALLMQVTDFRIDINTGVAKEKCMVNISFLVSETELDNSANKQETAINMAWTCAKEFITDVINDSTIGIEEDTIEAKTVFLRSDSGRTGVNISMTIAQKQGECL